jgi:uncharacterized membrane protein YhaH (DUF805 family)
MGVRQRLKESFLAFDTRLPWWLSYLGSLGRRKFLLGLLPLFVLGAILSGAELPLVLTIFLALPLIGVALGLFLQRLRDVGFPPALALLGFIPVFGWVALAVLSALPGKGRTGTPLWHSFVAGFSALIVISVLGTTPLPTTELVEGVNQGVASELEEEAELPGLTGVERGEPSGAVTEDTSALASAPEEDAEGEETEEEAPQEEETQEEVPDGEEPKEHPVEEEPEAEEPEVEKPRRGKGRDKKNGSNLRIGEEDQSEPTYDEMSVGFVYPEALEIEMLAYPNPSEGRYQLKLTGFEAGPVSMTVIDGSGREVRSIEQDYEGQGAVLRLDIQDQPAGVYLCYVRQGIMIKMLRLVKDR